MRWRARHLFKMDCLREVRHAASLATGGVILRKSAVLAAGNFNANLRHSEDADLGRRLLARGYDVIFDPALHVKPLTTNTLPEVLERYWRWYAGTEERASWNGYFKQVGYSIKVMARQDLESGDPLSALVSLFSPHYQFWRSRWRRGLFRTD
jgi:cellulose synthase/poly-beta-1,6-N-acetylglucosamine synthase-like glycosyltransferase